MNAKLSHIFKEMNQVEPSEKLGDLIIQRIGLEREKQARKKLFLSYAGLAASLLAIFPAILQFGIAFFHSEFWSIFTLAFSDFMVVAGSWREYLYSLGETFPILDIVAILIPVFGVLMFSNVYFSAKEKMKNSHIGSLRFRSI